MVVLWFDLCKPYHGIQHEPGNWHGDQHSGRNRVFTEWLGGGKYATIGARMTSATIAARLKLAFAFFLFITAVRMLYGVLA